WGFVVGAAPALLIVWVRLALREPERRQGAPTSSLDLFPGPLLRHTLVGVGLAPVRLATLSGTHHYGKNGLLHAAGAHRGTGPALKRWEMAGMLLTTLGGGAGLVCFGPLAERFGRRGAFLLYFAGGLAASAVLFQLLSGVAAVALFLPVFGFMTLGSHAGYD